LKINNIIEFLSELNNLEVDPLIILKYSYSNAYIILNASESILLDKLIKKNAFKNYNIHNNYSLVTIIGNKIQLSDVSDINSLMIKNNLKCISTFKLPASHNLGTLINKNNLIEVIKILHNYIKEKYY
jgi:aspartokinase